MQPQLLKTSDIISIIALIIAFAAMLTPIVWDNVKERRIKKVVIRLFDIIPLVRSDIFKSSKLKILYDGVLVG
jgi:hypothetical protein